MNIKMKKLVFLFRFIKESILLIILFLFQLKHSHISKLIFYNLFMIFEKIDRFKILHWSTNVLKRRERAFYVQDINKCEKRF